MEINVLGAQQMNSPYVPFSSQAPANLRSGEAGGFEEILRRAQNPEAAVPTSQRAVIDKSDKLYELCQDLETFLIKNLIKSMRSTVQKSELIDPGFAGEMYEDMLYDEYAKTFSKNANLGFAEMAYRELTGNR